MSSVFKYCLSLKLSYVSDTDEKNKDRLVRIRNEYSMSMNTNTIRWVKKFIPQINPPTKNFLSYVGGSIVTTHNHIHRHLGVVFPVVSTPATIFFLFQRLNLSSLIRHMKKKKDVLLQQESKVSSKKKGIPVKKIGAGGGGSSSVGGGDGSSSSNAGGDDGSSSGGKTGGGSAKTGGVGNVSGDADLVPTQTVISGLKVTYDHELEKTKKKVLLQQESKVSSKKKGIRVKKIGAGGGGSSSVGGSD
ncbi:hypothetical protein FRX31_002029 [Thalictrum thalictroides]|uniref:Uncharacterized protein n=1 Tax=Thalictrum thalictroides TaxID=46969 RepID=A0A7J6XGQ2_THATH|nr:hypothetical protein FRX31_002029 [Thalictrum thalictroides]